MRTEKEIREQLESIESVLELSLKLGMIDSNFSAFHVALEWVLQDSEESIESQQLRSKEMKK